MSNITLYIRYHEASVRKYRMEIPFKIVTIYYLKEKLIFVF